MNESSTKAIQVFFSYAHEDEDLRNEVEKHLTILKRQGIISSWYDRDITAGTEWAGEIDTHINTADVILLLISSDFLASDYCYDIELKRAMERDANREARVIPIILREVDWQGAPFGKLQALPTNAKPVNNWAIRDQAFADIARGIRKAIEELKKIGVRGLNHTQPEVSPPERNQYNSPQAAVDQVMASGLKSKGNLQAKDLTQAAKEGVPTNQSMLTDVEVGGDINLGDLTQNG